MSWSSSCTESNNFKVKDTKEVRAVLESMGFLVETDEDDKTVIFYSNGGDDGTYFDEDTEVVLSIKPQEDGTNLIGIISDSCMDSVDVDELVDKSGIVVQPITEYLQDMLLDETQYIIITSAGFESRTSYNFSPWGDITYINKNTVKFNSLYGMREQYIKSNP